MTEELRAMIEDSINDETDDIEKYKKMSDKAFECGLDEIAGVLLDIRHDEKTHKILLERML